MATYYVRKSGLDTNDGLSKGAAFLTIDKAANTVAAGDTVYVGAGVYRELVVMDTYGSSGSVISYIADIDGSQTDDPGLVVISAYDSETGAAQRTYCLELGTGDPVFMTWQGFVFVGGTTAVVGNAVGSNLSLEALSFIDCVMIGSDGNSEAIRIDINTGVAPTGSLGLQLSRCVIVGPFMMDFDENASSAVDMKMVIENCIFLGTPTSVGPTTAGVSMSRNVISSFGPGGIDITNCTFFSKMYAIDLPTMTDTTPAQVVTAANCVFVHCRYGLNLSGSNTGWLVSGGNNSFHAVTSEYVNVTSGTNDRSSSAHDSALFGGIADLALIRTFGWSPYRPWEPIRFQDDAYGNSVIGDANTSLAPAADFYGEARPMHGTADDRGAVEGRARPEPETTTVRTGLTSARFEGAGFHDALIPVSPVLTTVDVYARFDSNYTGSKPILEVLNIPGVADQSDIMTGLANQWEALQCTFTPTAAGVARVRIRSQDTSSTGEAFFDDLAVS